ncbi:MAG: T9SS type A sorting domain-containing protein [Bacteroidia bacterium]
MIKKLLSILLIASGSIATQAVAQCIPDVSCVPANKTFGICPDSTVGLPIGKVGEIYSATLSIKIPTTSDEFGLPGGIIDTVKVVGIENLAPGLTYKCVPANCKFLGGTTACLLISGIPTKAWNTRILIKLSLSGKVGSIPVNNYSYPNNNYKSIVADPNGIKDLDLAKFDVDQNSPNPFNEKSIINFSSINNSTVEFKVFNMLGKVEYSNVIKSTTGINTITLEANTFAPGIYVYSLKNNDRTITKRMIVSNK